MRLMTLFAALFLILVGGTPARAGPGLPKLVSLQVGPHPVTIYVDSATARTGANAFTLDMAGVPSESTVGLRLLGPGGQVVPVQLRRVKDPAGSNGGHGDAEVGAAVEGGSGHGSPDPHANASDHGADADMAVLLRGSASLPAPGIWQAELLVGGHDGQIVKQAAPFAVVYGGPNRIYLGATGLIMGSSLLYGMIRRHRR